MTTLSIQWFCYIVGFGIFNKYLVRLFDASKVYWEIFELNILKVGGDLLHPH